MPQKRSPRLLVSVRSLEEFARVERCDAVSIIDVKEPLHGSLGMVSAKLAESIALRPVHQRGFIRTSLAMGELSDHAMTNRRRLDHFDRMTGYDFAKVGLAGMAGTNDWSWQWNAWQSRLPPTTIPVAVAYADAEAAKAPSLFSIIEMAAVSRATHLLIDTFTKNRGDLFSWLDIPTLRAAIERTRQAGLKIVLAGSLCDDSLDVAIKLAPDFIGVRGAICGGARTDGIDEAKMAEVAAKFHRPA